MLRRTMLIARRFCLSLLFAAAVAGAGAQTLVTFTVNGTVNADIHGFKANDPLTITFTMSTASTPVGAYNNPYVYWIRDNSTSLFSSVSVTNLSGTWNGTVNPGGGITDDEIVINTSTSPAILALQSYAGSSGDNLRLLAPDSTPANFILVQAEWTGLSLPNSSIADPVAYFAARTGTYNFVPASAGFTYIDFTSGSLTFTPTTISISASAVPEPAADALLAGLGMVSFTLLRRRRAT